MEQELFLGSVGEHTMDVCSRRRSSAGFTLIELLIVVAIIGLLAAIAIPNLLEAMQRSRQKRTMADIRQAAMSWEMYETEYSTYLPSAYTPYSTTVDLADLKLVLEPTFTRVLIDKDGWGRDLIYATDTNAYQIISYGRDGDPSLQSTGATTNYDCDIVYGNGSFLVYPASIGSNSNSG